MTPGLCPPNLNPVTGSPRGYAKGTRNRILITVHGSLVNLTLINSMLHFNQEAIKIQIALYRYCVNNFSQWRGTNEFIARPNLYVYIKHNYIPLPNTVEHNLTWEDADSNIQTTINTLLRRKGYTTHALREIYDEIRTPPEENIIAETGSDSDWIQYTLINDVNIPR